MTSTSNASQPEPARPYTYGGQAVMEGVMIRGRRTLAIAVRRPDGEIITHAETIDGILQRHPLAKWPMIRGMLVLWETLTLGLKGLTYSANVATGTEDSEPIPTGVMWGAIIPALLFGVALFFVLPLLIVSWFEALLGTGFVANLVEGLIRIALLIGYIWLIGRSGEIQRVFAYHGAEHKSVHAWEHRVPLIPSEVQKFSPAHPRCGTAFLLTVMVVSVFVFAFLGNPPFVFRFLSRIVLIPVIAAIGYEILRASARHYESNALVRFFYGPTLWLQALTTREPDDSQVEVAIRSIQLAIDGDQEPVPAETDRPAP